MYNLKVILNKGSIIKSRVSTVGDVIRWLEENSLVNSLLPVEVMDKKLDKGLLSIIRRQISYYEDGMEDYYTTTINIETKINERFKDGYR